MLTFVFVRRNVYGNVYERSKIGELRKYGLGMCFDLQKNAYRIVNLDEDISVEYIDAEKYILVCARMMQGDDV